jgi:hypothetical protein
MTDCPGTTAPLLNPKLVTNVSCNNTTGVSEQISAYLGTLTPVTTGSDTWVTVSDLVAGRAVAISAVLQSGTAVLIDASGTPRVRCADGAPLAVVRAGGAFRDQLAIGTPWPGYASTSVVTIRPGSPMTQVTLSLSSGGLYGQSLLTPAPTTATVTAQPPVAVGVPAQVARGGFGDLGLSFPMSRPARRPGRLLTAHALGWACR